MSSRAASASQQRLARAAGADAAQWQQRRDDAAAELETIAEQIAAADEQAEIARRAGRGPGRCGCPTPRTRVRAAQARGNEQRSAGGAGAAADPGAGRRQPQRRRAEQRRCALRRERLARRAPRPGRARRCTGWTSCARQSAAADEAQAVAEAAAARAAGAGARARRPAPRPAAGRQRRGRAGRPTSAHAWTRCARCRTRCRPRASSSPGWRGTAWTAWQGLWTRIHIEPGWETALEAALRERLNALEVGRIETVRAFADDAPPARLAFYTPPAARDRQHPPARCRAWPTCCGLGDAGLQALLNDWLEGVYTAPTLDEALAAARQADAWRGHHDAATAMR